MSYSQQQYTATLPAMVTLPLAQWEKVLELLGSHPWRDVNPLIVGIHRQIQHAMNAQGAPSSGEYEAAAA
jgi:hypothetical protein